MKKRSTLFSVVVGAGLLAGMTAGTAVGNGGHRDRDDLWSVTRIVKNAFSSLQKSIDELKKQVGSMPGASVSSAPPPWSRALPVSERFQPALGGAAILDNETMLVWEQSPAPGFVDWSSAQSQCAQKTAGGRKGWRVPDAYELASLVDPAQTAPALPAGHPFAGAASAAFWSGNTSAVNSSFAAVVDFASGNIGFVDKDDSRPVWCVRGGASQGH